MELGLKKEMGKGKTGTLRLERRISMRSRSRLEDLPAGEVPQRSSRIGVKNLSPMTRFVATKRHPDWKISSVQTTMRRRLNLIDIVKLKRRTFGEA